MCNNLSMSSAHKGKVKSKSSFLVTSTRCEKYNDKRDLMETEKVNSVGLWGCYFLKDITTTLKK